MKHFFKIFCFVILFATITFALFFVDILPAQEFSISAEPQPVPLQILKRMFNNYSKSEQGIKVDGNFSINETRKFSEYIKKELTSSIEKPGLDQKTIPFPTIKSSQKNELAIYSGYFKESWVKTYSLENGNGTRGKAEATDLVIDNSGNIYVTGYSEKSRYGYNADYATIKYSSSGIEQWIARYNGPADYSDGATAIAVDKNGNVYVTGFSYSNETEVDYATIKYNASGVEQWVARYNGPRNKWDWATDLIVDDSGNVYVTGASDSYDEGDSLEANYDYATIKYDASGVELWVARYDGAAKFNDGAIAMSFIDSDNICVTGYSYAINARWDYLTIKYNSSGNEQWLARYNGPASGWDEPNDLVVDDSDNIYITGFSVGITSSSDYATIKYDASGVEQWVARYDGPRHRADRGRAIVLDNLGYVYVTGASTGQGADFDYATIKYSTSGVPQWISRYNGVAKSYDWAEDISIDNSGNIYVTGLCEGKNTQFDYATIKYDAFGFEQWIALFNGPSNKDDKPSVVAVDGKGNAYVTGYSEVRDYCTYATIKYTNIETVVPYELSVKTKDFRLEQNYPNPFNPKTTISYQIPVDSFVELTIYSVLGQKIKTLIAEQQLAGNYKFEWDASALVSSVYIYQLRTEKHTAFHKLLLLK